MTSKAREYPPDTFLGHMTLQEIDKANDVVRFWDQFSGRQHLMRWDDFVPHMRRVQGARPLMGRFIERDGHIVYLGSADGPR